MASLKDFLKLIIYFLKTHVAENPAECKLATSIYPECENYVDIYRRANLLTPKVYIHFRIVKKHLQSIT